MPRNEWERESRGQEEGYGGTREVNDQGIRRSIVEMSSRQKGGACVGVGRNEADATIRWSKCDGSEFRDGLQSGLRPERRERAQQSRDTAIGEEA